MLKKLIAIILISVLLSLLSACSNSKNQQGQPEQTDEPITLSMYFTDPGLMTPEEFQHMIADPTNKKYPHITMRQIVGSTQKISEYVTAGDFPDLIYTANLKPYLDIGIALDLNDLVKKHQMDLSKFKPVTLQAIGKFSTNGELYGIPFMTNFAALFYNKDIFDKFGVAYPKDGMIWEEALEVARKVTRQEDGVNYYGIHPVAITRLNATVGNQLYDPATNKAKFTTDGFKRVFNLYKEIFDIPGNNPNGGARKLFLTDRSLAMLPDYGDQLGDLEQLHKNGINMNWDVTSYPNYKELPRKALTTADHRITISATSKHKDTAFMVIQFLTDESVQTLIAKSGKPSSLEDPKYEKMFGQDLVTIKGKNIQSVFFNEPNIGDAVWEYSETAWKHLRVAAKEVMDGKKDVNTALRNAEEAANKEIDSMQ
jgi:multiple sugar transport system substrate-binding protein